MSRDAHPPKIKVVPNVVGAIGLVHPVDGPLSADGSTWTLDAFTNRKLGDESIRRKEIDPAFAKAEADQRAAAEKPAGGKDKAKANP